MSCEIRNANLIRAIVAACYRVNATFINAVRGGIGAGAANNAVY